MPRYDNLELDCLSDALEVLNAKEEPGIEDLEGVFTELAYVLDMLLEDDGASASRNLAIWAREHDGSDEEHPTAKEVAKLLDKWDVKDVKELTKKADRYVEIPVGMTFDDAEDALAAVIGVKRAQKEAEEKAKQKTENEEVIKEVRKKVGKK